MKVLMLTQVLPYPPDSGPKVKTYNMIKYISQAHELTLVSFVRGDQGREVEHLKQFCKSVYTVQLQRTRFQDGKALLTSLTTSTPWLIARDSRKAMVALLAELKRKENFDIVHVDQLNMAQYAPKLPACSRILDAHNALWLLYQRLARSTQNPVKALFLEREWRLMKRYEGKVCKEFDAVLAVSEADRKALADAANNQGNLTVAPIAVDPIEILPVDRVPEADHILHIGTMFWPPNVDGVLWFLREVYPIITNLNSCIHFDIVGARPPKEIADTARRLDCVNVAGFVKEPADYLKNTAVMVVPLLAGGGMRVKILEALAEGLPIVTTSIGCEGIAVENGKHLLIADTAQDFARATLRLIEDRDLANRLSKNGRQLIEKTYDYHFAYRPVSLVYEACLKI